MIQTNIEDFISIYETIIPQQKFVYLSTPITTGPRFLEWYNSVGKDLDDNTYVLKHKQEVIKPNETDAYFRAIKLSHQLGEMIVNPAQFKANLSQQQFTRFWVKFVNEHSSSVILSDGWALSKGCVSEFLAAEQNSIPYFDAELNKIPIDDAIKKIKEAILQLNVAQLNCDIQKGILEELW